MVGGIGQEQRVVRVQAPKWLRESMQGRRGDEPEGGARIKGRRWLGGPIPEPRKGAWAVLCPGSTVRLYEQVGRSAYAGVIGVNRAVCHYECDWSAMLDFKTFGEILKTHPDSNVGGFLGSPGLLVPEVDGRRILEKYEEARRMEPVLSMNRVAKERGLLGVPWTMNVATQVAWVLGATKVDVFGADWKGDRDVDGFRAVGDRSGLRWKKEHNVFRKVQQFLAEKGCVLTRVTPELMERCGGDSG